MKVGDKRVTMHETPPCEERERLSSKSHRLLEVWLSLRDDVQQTQKDDRAYSTKVQKMNEAHVKLKHAQREYYQHAYKVHGCR